MGIRVRVMQGYVCCSYKYLLKHFSKHFPLGIVFKSYVVIITSLC